MLSAALALLAPAGVNAWWRVACDGNTLVQERIDPIISPGVIPSNHVHVIEGGSAFAANVTFEQLRASSCSSCQVVPQDYSNYWYPKLYFQDPKTGLFDAVPDGGLLVYYEDRGDEAPVNNGPGLKAFPAGFRMITGDPTRRAAKYTPLDGSQGELQQRAIQWACIDIDERPGYNYESSWPTTQDGFPTSNCAGGLNLRLQFQSCWDGVNVDSDDHQSHVAYLTGLDNGACPDTHPVGLIHLFFEVTYDIDSFYRSGRWDTTEVATPGASDFPFVLATGDDTGYSWHGDFLNGWDVSALQSAIDDCTDDKVNPATANGNTTACPHLTVVSDTVAGQCTIAPVVNEALTGNLTKLPGCNPIQSGPGDSTLYSDNDCPI